MAGSEPHVRMASGWLNNVAEKIHDSLQKSAQVKVRWLADVLGP